MNASIVDQSAQDLATSAHAENTTRTRQPMKNVLWGTWLFVIGFIWILWNLWIINWRWVESYGFVIFGLLMLSQTILTRRFRLFLGSWMVLIGGFHFILSQSDMYRMREVWPIYALLTGLAFLIHFVADVRRWFSLVAFFLCTGFGSIYLARNLFLLSHEVARTLHTYWPLSLVIAGVLLILLALWQSRRKSF